MNKNEVFNLEISESFYEKCKNSESEVLQKIKKSYGKDKIAEIFDEDYESAEDLFEDFEESNICYYAEEFDGDLAIQVFLEGKREEVRITSDDQDDTCYRNIANLYTKAADLQEGVYDIRFGIANFCR